VEHLTKKQVGIKHEKLTDMHRSSEDCICLGALYVHKSVTRQ
jgi:hypothetical protein